jgi:hypothetical protein
MFVCAEWQSEPTKTKLEFSVDAFLARKCSPSVLTLKSMFAEYAFDISCHSQEVRDSKLITLIFIFRVGCGCIKASSPVFAH